MWQEKEVKRARQRPKKGELGITLRQELSQVTNTFFN